MKDQLHSTNYFDTFITVAPDSTATTASMPPARKEPSVSQQVFEMISANPYKFTSDDVIFDVWATRQGIAKKDRADARAAFFSKGQPCLRASDLCKKYGWGFHFDAQGRVAMFAVESKEYKKFAAAKKGLTIKPAMRSSKAK